MAFVRQQLKTITEEIWQQKLTIDENDFDKNDEYFLEYIQCICNNVEDLTFVFADDTKFINLENVQFSNVNTLSLFIEIPNDKEIKKHNENSFKIFEKIIQIFPKLTKLQLPGSDFTGKHLWIFENIEELNLNHCYYLEPKYFGEIFTKLKNLKKLSILFNGYDIFYDVGHITLCRRLEEILIDDFSFIKINENLFELKNLRKIVCVTGEYFTTDILKLIVNKIGNVIHTLVFEDNFVSSAELCLNLQKMITLRRLVFYRNYITEKQLCDIGKLLSNTLEEVYFRKRWYVGYEREALLNLVLECRNLKIFDLSGTNINVNFVERVAEIIANDHENRNQILIMHCGDTRITKEHLETLQLPEKLKISFKFNKLDLQGESCLHCEWSPQSDENS